MKAKILFVDNFKGYRGAILGSTLPEGALALVTALDTDVKPDGFLLFFDLRNSKGANLDVYWLAEAG